MKKTAELISALAILLVLTLGSNVPALAQTRDEQRAAAEKAFNEAVNLSEANKPELVPLAMQKYQEAQNLYHQIGDKREEANALRGVARSYLSLNNRDEAIKAYQAALGLFEEIPRKTAIALVSMEIGDVYIKSANEKDLRLAIEYYGKALPIFTELNDKKNKALALGNSGRAYMVLQNKERALEFLGQALSLFQEMDDKQYQADIHFLIGNSYDFSREVEDRRRALEHFLKAAELYSLVNNAQAKKGKADSLLNSGNDFIFLSNREEAIKYYMQALALYRELKSQIELAMTLDNLGNAYVVDEKNIQQAVSYYLEAARTYLDTKDTKPDGAEVLARVGSIYLRLRDKEQALSYYRKAQAVYQELASQNVTYNRGVAQGFTAIGVAYEYLGDKNEKLLAAENYRKAEAIYREAADLFRKQNNKENLVQALRELGDVRFRLRDKAGAVEAYKQAANVSKEIPNEASEAYMLAAISYTYAQSGEAGDIQQSIVYDQMAQKLFNKLGDKNSEIWSLKRIASGYAVLNNWEAYLKANSDLMKIADSLNTPAKEILQAEVHVVLGNAYQMREKPTEALAEFNSALTIGRTLKNTRLQYDALYSLIQLYFILGEPKKLLDASDELLHIMTPYMSDNAEKAYIYSMRGYAYKMLGEKAKGDAELNTGIQYMQNIQEKDVADAALALTGNSYLIMGKKEEERKRFAEVERGLARMPDDEVKGFSLYYLAISRAAEDDYAKAWNYAEQALAISRKTNNRIFEALLLTVMGFIKWEEDKNQESIALFQQALIIFRKFDAQQFEVYTLTGLMQAWRDAGNPRVAIFYGKQAIKIFQRVRTDNKSLESEVQKSFTRELSELYKTLTTLLLTQGRSEEAQQVINLSRDEEFFDLGNDQDQTPGEIQFTPLEQESALLWEAGLTKTSQAMAELDLVKFRPVTPSGSDLKQNIQPLETAYQQSYAEYLSNLKKIEESFNQPPGAKDKLTVSDVVEMRAVLCDLTAATKENTSALYTFIGAKKLYVLLNTCNEPVKIFESSIAEEDLNRKILMFYDLLQSKVYDPRLLGKEIYRLIIPQGLETELQNKKVATLMWSLDGELRYIPMAALSPDDTHYLVERYNNVVFTRANKKRMIRTAGFDWTGYGFFTSEAHKVSINGESIEFVSLDKDERQIFSTKAYSKGIISGDVFPEADFTADSLFNITKQKRPLIHISSHFRFYPGDLERSFLLLGNGKVMSLAEMKAHGDLFQDVQLLTLSACDTAAQLPNADGKEVDGFAELAQRLGAGSVMASLWSVADISTTQLMKGFYRNRQLGKLNKAEALRKAQLDLLYGRDEDASNPSPARSKPSVKGGDGVKGAGFVDQKYLVKFQDNGNPFSHPYYWSPFVLFGNPR